MGRRWLRSVDAVLQRLSRHSVLVLALLLAVGVGVTDTYFAPDLLVLYLVPIFAAAWYGGPRPGLVVAMYAAGSGYITQQIVTGDSLQTLDGAQVGSFLVRLVAYVLIAQVTARLRESRRQQQDLIGFMVHDLRSPISSSITGLMTLEQTAEHLAEADREMVQLALVSNQRALTLVNSMLDVAKLESGSMAVHREEADLAALLDDAVRVVALWAQGADVAVRSDVRVERFVLDASLTGRILTNLLSNALKFSPPGSTVTVGVESEPHGVRFWVEDQGQGIPAEFVETIFEPFAQVKGTKGGTGLGLTFCRLAVRAQGGRIGVKSRVGEGSTFWFTLPMHSVGDEPGSGSASD